MSPVELLGAMLLLAGAGFFTAGTVGLVRFPDAHTQLHALTKADNLGLGLVVVGLAITAPSLWIAAKLLLIWGVALAAGATAAHLIASHLDRVAEG